MISHLRLVVLLVTLVIQHAPLAAFGATESIDAMEPTAPVSLTDGAEPLDTVASTDAAELVDTVDASNASLSYLQMIERVAPMDTTGLPSGLATVLRNYYLKNFTDEDTWARVESIRFDGTLHLPQGVLRFTAFKKKPDFCKVVLYANGGQVVMAYDGVDAWQQNTISSRADSSAIPHPSSSPMASADALNFIRDATTGGHLLYPLISGKKMELLGTTTIDGERYYDLKITLPDGQQIRSQLDRTSFAEVRQVTLNNLNGDEEVTTHSDFHRIEGIRIPFTSILSIDGQQVHQSRIERVQVNQGVMPWMFTRPTSASDSATAVPGPRISASAAIAASESVPLASPSKPSLSGESAPSTHSFSTQPNPTDSKYRFGDPEPSVFNSRPDLLSAQEFETLTQQITQPPTE